MDKELYKEVELENGTIKIFDKGEIVTYYAIPEWNREDGDYELAFRYNKTEHFLSEFTNIHNKVWNPNPSEWMKEFDGQLAYTAFSGLLIKLIDNGEAVQVYYFYC